MLEQVMAGNGSPVPLVEGGDCRVFQFHSDTGEGIMTQYDLFPGVSLMYNDFHMPRQITIPMAVMFRFFPTVMEEWRAIGDAMKMRGIRLRGGKAGSILEYRLVPMLMCSVKIGEELSAASLTRGLGGPVKRTNVCNIGIHVQDVFMLLFCFAGLVVQIILWIRG